MSNVIAGTSSIGGTINGNWSQGLSAYDLAVRYEGFRGSIKQWLESLKGSSVTISNIEQQDDGVQITFTDSSGDKTIKLQNGTAGPQGEPGSDGISPVVSIEQNDNGYNLTITDINGERTIPINNGEKGEKGENGENGIPVVLMCTRDGVVYWRYSENDNNWKELIDLGTLADTKYEEAINNHKNIVFVDELVDPETADPNIIYILREEDDG